MICVGGSVAVSGVLAHAPVFTAEALRYALACLILLVLARLAGRRLVMPQGTEWLWLAGIAVTGLVLFNVALVAGSRHAEPAVLGVAVACVPAVLAVIGPLLEGSRPRAAGVAAALVVTCGAALVQGLGRTDGLGVAWAAVVFGCEAAFTLLAIPVLGRHGPWGVSVHTTWIAAVIFAAIGLVHEGPGAAARLGTRDWLAVGYLAVAVTAVAFVMWYSSVGRLGASRAGLLTGVAPVAAAAVGVLLGGPAPRPLVWAGLAVVAAGLALGLRGATRNRDHQGRGHVLSAFGADLAGLPGPGSGGPVRRGHHRRRTPAGASPAADRFAAVAKSRLAGVAAESELPEIQAWRRAFAAMGLKPTQYRCASESLLRRFRKEGSLPRLHPLVDLCNAVSLAFAIPVAVLDAVRRHRPARGPLRDRRGGVPDLRRGHRASGGGRGDLRRPGRAGPRPALDEPPERPLRGPRHHQHRPDRGRSPARFRARRRPRPHRGPGRRTPSPLDHRTANSDPDRRRAPVHPRSKLGENSSEFSGARPPTRRSGPRVPPAIRPGPAASWPTRAARPARTLRPRSASAGGAWSRR